MKIAVVGSGISGLAATWFLSKAHEVTLYERSASIGMDTHSVEVEGEGGTVYLNAPMRVFFALFERKIGVCVHYIPVKKV